MESGTVDPFGHLHPEDETSFGTGDARSHGKEAADRIPHPGDLPAVGAADRPQVACSASVTASTHPDVTTMSSGETEHPEWNIRLESSVRSLLAPRAPAQETHRTLKRRDSFASIRFSLSIGSSSGFGIPSPSGT